MQRPIQVTDVAPEPVVGKFTGNMATDTPGDIALCKPAQSKCAWTKHNSHLVWKFTIKTTGDTSGDIVLCKPAQSKCTWTSWHVTRGIMCGNLQGKCRTRIPQHPFCASLRSRNASQDAFCAEIYRENTGCFRYHLDWTPGLNCYRKNPSVWPHCLGMFGE